MILLVENDDAFAEVYIAIFASVGLLVTRAFNSTEALLSIRRCVHDAIVIGDARLARAGRSAFCRSLRQSTSERPIPIILIGHTLPVAGSDTPFDAFVRRPCSVAGLLSTVLALTRSQSLLSRTLRMFKGQSTHERGKASMATGSLKRSGVSDLLNGLGRGRHLPSPHALIQVGKTDDWSCGCWSTAAASVPMFAHAVSEK